LSWASRLAGESALVTDAARPPDDPSSLSPETHTRDQEAPPMPPPQAMTPNLTAIAQERPKLAEQLRTLPERPGVYLFKHGKGRLLYVGKAESLRDRVRSYFQPSTSFDITHQPKLKTMTQLAQSVEYILTDSPIQALIWENDLVRKEQPRYNTKLRD